MPRYSKLIKCNYCNGNYKSKKERKARKYICSRYDNFGDCVRIPIKESWIDELIEMRFRRKLSDEEVKREIKSIEVSKDKIQINYTNKNEEPTILQNNFAQY